MAGKAGGEAGWQTAQLQNGDQRMATTLPRAPRLCPAPYRPLWTTLGLCAAAGPRVADWAEKPSGARNLKKTQNNFVACRVAPETGETDQVC